MWMILIRLHVKNSAMISNKNESKLETGLKCIRCAFDVLLSEATTYVLGRLKALSASTT